MKLAKHQDRDHYEIWVPQLLLTLGLRSELKWGMPLSRCGTETSQVWKFQFGAATQSSDRPVHSIQ